ncbi:UTRA domain-containing protein [Halomonas vilamensis]|uniref:UTRA domain-containing protein n=1 Tax=Vreelandella vilamensis TaxID=531309 RepID=A0ABU1H7W0_9GAMM|nr:UTRA domain-containing protein [Halomonas vilamensis]MDR5900397.1 UTRA domain-containing protein [Halomonas vilamensis]
MAEAYYLHVTDKLRDVLLTDDTAWVNDNGKLPAERELAQRFETTRVTLRQALAQLEGEGRIHRSNRRGWFVSPKRLEYDPTRDAGFNDYVRDQGRLPRTEVLSVSTSSHPPAAKALGLVADQTFYHIRRRRYVDERAVLVESLWVVPERAPGLLDERFDFSLWKLLREKWNLRLSHRSISMVSEALQGADARELGVAAGTAGLNICRTILDGDQRPVEYDEEHWLHDALSIRVELKQHR